MVLVGVEQQLGWYAMHACCAEGTLSLAMQYAIVLLAMDTQDGGIPLVYV